MKYSPQHPKRSKVYPSIEPMQKSSVDVVVVALSSPILIGVYKEGSLFKEYQREEKTSEILPQIFQDIEKDFQIKRVFFARGPGSFMSLKLVYIFLKTLEIAKGIQLFGCEGFEFNQNAPIKAVGNLYFVKENGKIVTKKFDKPVKSEFSLPKNLKDIKWSGEDTPLYVLPAVKV